MKMSIKDAAKAVMQLIEWFGLESGLRAFSICEDCNKDQAEEVLKLSGILS